MLSSAMLLLLPVALAALCPCPPPSSEDSPVCGSDGRTYSSECQLQCADQPGLSATHLGPCNTTVVASRRRRYTVEAPEWSKCFDDRQCDEPHMGNCKECAADDEKCRLMCNENCACGCAGLPTGGLDEDSHDRWYKCCEERGCTLSKSDECKKNCGGNQFCSNLCHMEWIRCSCGCVQLVANTRTSTTAAPTTSTTTPPTSTTTTPTTSTTTPPATSSSATAATNSTLTASAAAPGPAAGSVTTATDQRANQHAGANVPCMSVNLTWDSGVVLVLVCVLVCVTACVLVRCWRAPMVCCPLGGDQRLTALCRVGEPSAAKWISTKKMDSDDVELNSYPPA